MPVQLMAVVAILALVVGFALVRMARAWWKFRGRAVVTCPESQRPAGVVVDTRHAAWTGVAGTPRLQLATCSRWPERAGCGQQCLSQIEAAPQDCLVRNILVNWYAGKSCAACGRPIGEIVAAGSQPALLLADKVSVEWSQVPAEKLGETLAAAQPICFGCHMANTLVHEHPELAVDRHRGAMS